MYLPSTPPFILIFQSKIRALQDAVKRNDLSFIAKNSGEVRLLQGEPIDSHEVVICSLPINNQSFVYYIIHYYS